MNKSWFEPRMQIRYCHATTAKFFPVNAIKRQTMEKKTEQKRWQSMIFYTFSLKIPKLG